MSSTPQSARPFSAKAEEERHARIRLVISDKDLALLHARESAILNFHAAYGLTLPLAFPLPWTMQRRRRSVKSLVYCLLERNGHQSVEYIPNLCTTIVYDLIPVLGVWDYLPEDEASSTVNMPNPFEVLDDGDSVMTSNNKKTNRENTANSCALTIEPWPLDSPTEMESTPLIIPSPVREMAPSPDIDVHVTTLTELSMGYEEVPLTEDCPLMTQAFPPNQTLPKVPPTAPRKQAGKAIDDWAKLVKGGEDSSPSIDHRSLREALWNIKDHPQSMASFALERNRENCIHPKNPSSPFDFICAQCFARSIVCNTITSPGLNLEHACLSCIAAKEVCGFVSDEAATIQTSVGLSCNPELSTMCRSSMALCAAIKEANAFIEAYQYGIDHAEKLLQAWLSDVESLGSHIDNLYLVSYAFNKYKNMLEEDFEDSIRCL
ncbi:hypothetical protein DL96DRAFT_1714595 [Flagelloscypha sp. PMI_526]|nr:hypothetical protein DL96DRAFT_1714595 [Flagelloscypha sp. PMI_526]